MRTGNSRYSAVATWFFAVGCCASLVVMTSGVAVTPCAHAQATVTQGTTGAAQPTTGQGTTATAAGDATSADQPAASPATSTAGEGVAAPSDNEAQTQEEVDAGAYAVRLRDLEQRINELKEQIFRSKARLSLLAETVLSGVVAGSQAVISHENRMSSTFRLVKVVYLLDGAPIFNKADAAGVLGEQTEFDVYNGSIVPGEHTLTVNLEYRGHGSGIFRYLEGFVFRVRSSHTFTAPEGRQVALKVVGFEQGGPTEPLHLRPAVRFNERLGAVGGEQPGDATTAPSTETSSSSAPASGTSGATP